MLGSLGENVSLHPGNEEGTEKGLKGGKNPGPYLLSESGISPNEGFGKERFYSFKQNPSSPEGGWNLSAWLVHLPHGRDGGQEQGSDFPKDTQVVDDRAECGPWGLI